MGIAMLWIMGYHLYLHDMTFYDSSFKLYSHIFKFGYVGVDIFFFLSAYGLCHSFSTTNIKVFYYKRFVRIVPLFTIFALFSFIIMGENYMNFPRYVWLRLLQISSISVIESPFTCPEQWIRIDWFVPAIINLYIIFPLLYRTVSTVVKYAVIWHILFLLSFFYMAHFLWGYIDGLYVTRLPIAIMGIFTYFYLNSKAYDKLWLLLAVLSIQVFFIERHNLMYSAPVPLILYGLSMANINISLFSKLKIKTVGKCSFELFLSHGFAKHYLTSSHIVVNYVIFVVITIVLGLVLHSINKWCSQRLLAYCP